MLFYIYIELFLSSESISTSEIQTAQWCNFIIEPRSDKRDLLAIKVKSEIFTEKERPSCCEQLQKISSSCEQLQKI